MAGTRNVSNIFIENLENTYSHLINLYVRRCLGKNCGTYILYSNVAIFKEQYLFLLYGWICKLASCFDWLPKQGRRAHLACFEFPTLVLQQKGFFWPYNLILYWHSLFGQEEWILAFMLIILCRWPCKFIIYYHITVIFARLLQNIVIFVISIAVF